MSVTNDFLQNASTFNCGLIALEKLDTVECQRRGFHGNNHTMLARAIRDLAELKQRLVKVLPDFKLTIVDRAIDQWRKQALS